MSRIKSKKYSGVYISPLKNNDKSYYITYKDVEGKKVWIKIGLHSEGVRENFCYQKRAEEVNKLRLGEDTTVGNKKKKVITLNELFKIAFKDKELHNKGYESEVLRYGKHLRNSLGKYYIEDIKKDDIIKLQMLKKEEGYADATINHIVRIIHTCLNYAIKHKIYKETNPCLDIKYFTLDNTREKFLKTNEIKILYKRLEYDSELLLFTKLALCTGGRLESIVELQKKSFDFDNKIVRIVDFKNKSTYIGHFNDELCEILREKVKDKDDGDRIFTYEKIQISKRMLRILSELFNKGIDSRDSKNRTVIHTLRHTFASHLAINGCPIMVIKQLMNHKDIKMTMRYAKLAPDSGKDSVEKLYKL